jgi:hypothetical protein
MTHSIRLVCEEPRLRGALQSWLDGAALAPPVPLSLVVRMGTPPVLDTRAAVAFHQPTLAIYTGAADGRVSISWDVAPAVATIEGGATTACVTLSPAAVEHLGECQRTLFITVLILLLRRAGWHHVHAATAIDPSNRGWLLAGNANAGKSTTAALLASHGWRVGTDDTAFLAPTESRVAVTAFRGLIALRPGGLALLARGGGQPLRERRKTGYSPEELGGCWAERVVPDIIVFPSVGADTTHAAPLSPAQALRELVRWSAWVVLEPDLAQEHLDLLARLAQQARSYRVTLGRDLFDQPNRLAELVA